MMDRPANRVRCLRGHAVSICVCSFIVSMTSIFEKNWRHTIYSTIQHIVAGDILRTGSNQHGLIRIFANRCDWLVIGEWAVIRYPQLKNDFLK